MISSDDTRIGSGLFEGSKYGFGFLRALTDPAACLGTSLTGGANTDFSLFVFRQKHKSSAACWFLEARVGAQQARSFAANGAASVRRPPADFKHAEQLGFLMFCWNIFLFNGNVGFL